MRALGLALAGVVVLAAAPPAHAAGVGFSLPKLRRLAVADAGSWGASVQVVGGAFSVGPLRLDLALDYAYTRDFGAATNYAFFDATGGLGLPLGLPGDLTLEPAVDAHALAFYQRGLKTTLRLIVCRSYQILYVVDERREAVKIVHVWHGARDETPS